MRIARIDFYYFSGTGNTYLIVRKMKETFEENGVEVNLFPIESSDPQKVKRDRVIGLGFPVAMQGTYPFIWDFAKALPPSDGTPVFMVDTLQAFSGGIVGPLRKIIQKKGYKPIGAKEIRMPNNLLPKKIDQKKVEEKIQKGLKIAEQYAKDILCGKARWRRISILSDLISIPSKNEFSYSLFRKLYPLQIDYTKCTKCGICAKLCPVNNILMNEYPHYQNRCKLCMRCISFCPVEAILVPEKKYQRYHAINLKELLEYREPSETTKPSEE